MLGKDRHVGKRPSCREKAVMPGHDPASMNSDAWIAGQACNDSLLFNDSLLSSTGMSLWIQVS